MDRSSVGLNKKSHHNDEQIRRQYETEGYVIFRKTLSNDQLEALRASTDDAIAKRIPPILFEVENQETSDAVPELYKDSNGAVFRRLNRVFDRGGIFQEVICGPLAQAALHFIKPPLSICLNRHNMLMLKAPHNQTPVVWHQDAALWNEGTYEHLSAIVAIDDFLPDNGPLEVVPGSHRSGAISPGSEHIAAVKEQYRASIERDSVIVDLQAGDAVFFHGLLLHGSGSNLSSKPRRSLTVAFYPGDLREVSSRTGEHEPQVHMLAGEK